MTPPRRRIRDIGRRRGFDSGRERCGVILDRSAPSRERRSPRITSRQPRRWIGAQAPKAVTRPASKVNRGGSTGETFGHRIAKVSTASTRVPDCTATDVVCRCWSIGQYADLRRRVWQLHPGFVSQSCLLYCGCIRSRMLCFRAVTSLHWALRHLDVTP